MNSREREYDDLTVISGIKEKRQQLLRDSLNVRTYLDLAELSIEEIESALKAEGQIVSRDAIREWIAQAKERAATVNSSSQHDKEHTGDSEWTQFASFVVAFETRKVDDQIEEKRTTVHYVEEDTGETWQGPSWSGIVSEQPCQWMLEQLDEKDWQQPKEERPTQAPPTEVPRVEPPPTEPPPVETTPTEPSPAEVPPMTVEITQIRAFQPPGINIPTGIGEANQPFIGLLRRGEPFVLEVAFVLPELAAADILTREIPYGANFYVRNMATGASLSLGDTEPDTIVSGKASYLAKLPDEVALQPGMYHLGVLLRLRSRPPSATHLEVPLLQVV